MNEPAGLLMRPELIALALIVAGVIAARLASLGTGVLLNSMDRRTARISTSDASLISPRVIRVSKSFVFWALIVLAVTQALRVLGVGGLSSILAELFDFMPRLLVAFSIVLAGHLLGITAAHLAARLGDTLTPDSVGPRALYGLVLTVAIVMGLQHVSVDITFVAQLVLILVATVSAGLMLAFGLGARQHVANLMARRELARLAIGQRVRIDDTTGSIVDIYDTGIDVANDDGVVSIPAARLAEVGVLRLSDSESDG